MISDARENNLSRKFRNGETLTPSTSVMLDLHCGVSGMDIIFTCSKLNAAEHQVLIMWSGHIDETKGQGC